MHASMLLLSAALLLGLAANASATAPATETAQTGPVEVYPCFGGGTTVVVMGRTVAECIASRAGTDQPSGALVELYPCFGGGTTVVVAGRPVAGCIGQHQVQPWV